MNNCYDGRLSVKIIALAAVLCVPAEAQLWQAAVAPPRPGLPAVTIALGYPGPYTPSINCPIALRATGAGVVFDGYIGYHFEVAGRRTLDTPVVARALIQPHGQWSFSTFVTMRGWGGTVQAAIVHRELVIEWLDSNFKVIASKSAGLPSWSKRMPLRIGGAGAFGAPAYAAPSVLPDSAQWYAGFSRFIAPLDAWIDLPRPVRDAIFGSGIPIVLIGPPRANQRLDDLDRTLLPVTFTSSPGAYTAPWPYRQSPMTIMMSWRAKAGVDFIGPDSCPYLAATSASTWAADEGVLGQALPMIVRSGAGGWSLGEDAEPGHDKRPAELSGAVLLLCVAAWFCARRKSLIVVAGALIAATVAAIAFERDRVRPPDGTAERTVRASIAPGIVDEVHVLREHGAAPLPEHRADRAGLTGDFGFPEDAELRRSQTPPSMGALNHGIDYDWTMRWTYRRTLAASSPEAFFTRDINDFHNGVSFMALHRPRGRSFSLHTFVPVASGGYVSCWFGLPADTRGVATLSVSSLSNDRIEIAYASGTTKLTTTRKDVYSPSTVVIPPNLLRDIVAGGGIFEVRTTHVTSANGWPVTFIAFRVQENKS